MAHTLIQNIPTTSDGFTLLGSPIGTANVCESNLSIRVNKIREALSCLGDLQDSQMETTLLRSCLTLPKLAYILRCCPPALIPNALCFIARCPLRSLWQPITRRGLAEGISAIVLRRCWHPTCCVTCTCSVYWFLFLVSAPHFQHPGSLCQAPSTFSHGPGFPTSSCR